MVKNFMQHSFWNTYALVIARVLMGGVFVMASIVKFQDILGTAGYIAQAGFPAPMFLAWVAAFFELLLGLAIITGFWFREAAVLLAAYAVFLAFAFHGPSTWKVGQVEFGFFVDHLVMFAGLLFMVAHGAGSKWVVKNLF
jgi:uncharacterized membrane protein YphA (DoxX/SURF4 family)